MRATKKKAAKEKPPLSGKDWPNAPIGQATDPRCVCHFGVVCELHHDKPWEHDIAEGPALPALNQTVSTKTNRMLFLQPSTVRFSPARESRLEKIATSIDDGKKKKDIPGDGVPFAGRTEKTVKRNKGENSSGYSTAGRSR